MKISTLINYAGGFKEAVAEIKELEQAGLDVVWVPKRIPLTRPRPWAIWRRRQSTSSSRPAFCRFTAAPQVYWP